MLSSKHYVVVVALSLVSIYVALTAIEKAKNTHILTIVHINDFHANYQPKEYRYGGAVSPLSLIKGYYNKVKRENGPRGSGQGGRPASHARSSR